MDSRAALLQAAAEEFALSGLKGTRIREIVQRSGVNERMIYHHFGSKEGLFKAVVEHEFGGMGRDWRAALAQVRGLAPYEGMRLAFSTLFDLVHNRPLIVALALQEGIGGYSAREPLTTDALPAELRELHERGVETGVFRRDVDFDVLYATVLAAVMVTPNMAGRFPSLLAERGMDGLREQLLALVMDGLTGGAT
jgi:TetR/AcrR family transcriptional regulator